MSDMPVAVLPQVVLNRAGRSAGDRLSKVRADDLGRATPCADWLLADLLVLAALGRCARLAVAASG